MKVPKLVISLVILLLSFSSCVKYKDVAYLQDATFENGINPKDSNNVSFETELIIQPYDIIDLKIGTSKQGFDKLFESQTGDLLAAQKQSNVSSSTQPNYFNAYSVDLEGNLNLPLLNKVRVAGSTLAQAKEILLKKAKEFLQDPYVEMRYSSFKIQVLGQVKTPGTIIIPNEKANIFEALSIVGDQNDFGDSKNILLVRGTGEKRKIFKIDLTKKEVFDSKAYHLLPNDIVIVNPQKRKFTNATLQALIPIATVFNILISILALSRTY